MKRFCRLFVKIAFLTFVFLAGHTFCACFIWHSPDGRAANTGMFIVSKDVLIDPDSIGVDYEDEYIRRSSLCLLNVDSHKMIQSYAVMHFLEDKAPGAVYYSRDGVYYEPVRFDNKEDTVNRAYRWLLSWIGNWE